jgi:hypothetical protein
MGRSQMGAETTATASSPSSARLAQRSQRSLRDVGMLHGTKCWERLDAGEPRSEWGGGSGLPVARSRKTWRTTQSAFQGHNNRYRSVRVSMTSKPLRTLVLLAACLGGCAHVLPPSAFEGSTPEMRPEDFFAGATTSSGILANSAGSPTQRWECQKPGALRREWDCLVAKAPVQHCGPDLKHAVGAAGRPAHLSALVHAGTHQLVDGALGP